MFKRKNFRAGWLVAVVAMTALACTCGPLAQVTEGVSTVQALSTQAQGLATEGASLATDVATSGLLETVEAVATSEGGDGGNGDVIVGDLPEDIPLYPDYSDLVAGGGSLTFTAQGSFDEVVDFYKTEMPNNGWTQTLDPVVFGDSAVMSYQKDGRQAAITVTNSGGQILVTAGVTQ